MKWLMTKWLILTISIMIASYLIEGIKVSGFFSAFFAAAILGILNVFFKPVLLILTLPVNILTLGLFTFVINAMILMMASGVIKGFYVSGFWSAVFGSIVISIISWILNEIVFTRIETNYMRRDEYDEYIDLKKKDDDTWGI